MLKNVLLLPVGLLLNISNKLQTDALRFASMTKQKASIGF
jgi:hypothetical protein